MEFKKHLKEFLIAYVIAWLLGALFGMAVTYHFSVRYQHALLKQALEDCRTIKEKE